MASLVYGSTSSCEQGCVFFRGNWKAKTVHKWKKIVIMKIVIIIMNKMVSFSFNTNE